MQDVNCCADIISDPVAAAYKPGHVLRKVLVAARHRARKRIDPYHGARLLEVRLGNPDVTNKIVDVRVIQHIYLTGDEYKRKVV
jgi:hypothetical protein